MAPPGPGYKPVISPQGSRGRHPTANVDRAENLKQETAEAPRPAHAPTGPPDSDREPPGRRQRQDAAPRRLRWVEPWYATYALLGAARNGLVPILLPLAVGLSGGAAQAGLVMGAVSLGGLSAPLWGRLADRRRLHRWILVGGLLATAAALVGFALVLAPYARIALALMLGVSMSAANTVATLFVVEVHPKEEWGQRIGWLQTFFGVGHTAGLLLAGALGRLDWSLGLLIAAGLALAAAPVGWATTTTPPARLPRRPPVVRPAPAGEWPPLGPLRHHNHLTGAAVRQLRRGLRSRFGLFMGLWTLAFIGSSGVFSLYPLAMQEQFGISPAVSATAFAVATGASIFLYTPAGGWVRRFGPTRVLQAGLGLRVLAFAGLAALAFIPGSDQAWLAPPAAGLGILAWSLLSVSGTGLVTGLSPLGRGETLGIYNAFTALAGAIGAALGGWVVAHLGYGALCAAATVAILLSLGASGITRKGPERTRRRR